MSEFPYRSSIESQTASEKREATVDERDLSTLISIQNILQSQIDMLDSFKAFDSNMDANELLMEVKSRQMAFNILSPILTAVNDAIERVKIQGKK